MAADTPPRLAALLRRVPDGDRALLSDMLSGAEGMARAYLGYGAGDALPDALDGVIVRLAAGLYNQIGDEGASAHAMGGVSRTEELLDAAARDALNRYRRGTIL